jgi:cell division protein FtsW
VSLWCSLLPARALTNTRILATGVGIFKRWSPSWGLNKVAKKLAFDKVLFTTALLLVVLGLLMVYSASAVIAGGGALGLSRIFLKQVLAVGLGSLVLLAVMHVDYRKYRNVSVVYGILASSIALLGVVLFSPPINGTRRWILAGGFSFQPSEFAKLALVIYLAFLIDRTIDRERDRELLWPACFVTGLMVLLILFETDLGTSLVLIAATGAMLFLAGLRWRYFFAGGAILVPLVWLLVISVPYRRQRLLTFLDPEADPLNHGYQAMQSLIAIGSGGPFGLGPGQSLQKLYFLPYPHSDFIFSILAEELGLIGAVFLLVLFALLIWRGVRAGLNAPDHFGRYLAWGITGVISVQALMHASVAVSLMPTTGIPLPLISYGGSSMLISLAGLGVLLNISQHG